MKKLVALLLVIALVACMFAGCGSKNEESKLKIGAVLVGDENEGYSYAHIMGIEKAMEAVGMNKETDIVWKYCIGEDETCYDAIVDCIKRWAENR